MALPIAITKGGGPLVSKIAVWHQPGWAATAVTPTPACRQRRRSSPASTTVASFESQ